jgi:hypothetical protein
MHQKDIFKIYEALIIFVCQVYFASFTFGHGYDVENRNLLDYIWHVYFKKTKFKVPMFHNYLNYGIF